MAQDLVTVGTYSQPMEAHMARLRLEQEGIFCFLKDESTVQANWMYSLAVGGVKLQVPEEDAEHARAVLSEIPEAVFEDSDNGGASSQDGKSEESSGLVVEGDSEPIDAAMDAIDALKVVPYGGPCPSCGSSEVVRENAARRLTFLSWLVLSVPIPVVWRRWRCRSCGHRWRGKEHPVSDPVS